MSDVVQIRAMPERVHTLDEMFGAIKALPNVQTVVTLVEDDKRVWMIAIDGTTAERLNWMLDRAKLLLHRAD